MVQRSPSLQMQKRTSLKPLGAAGTLVAIGSTCRSSSPSPGHHVGWRPPLAVPPHPMVASPLCTRHAGGSCRCRGGCCCCSCSCSGHSSGGIPKRGRCCHACFCGGQEQGSRLVVVTECWLLHIMGMGAPSGVVWCLRRGSPLGVPGKNAFGVRAHQVRARMCHWLKPPIPSRPGMHAWVA